MLRWEGWNGDEAKSHTADLCEWAEMGAGKIGGAFVGVKRPYVIVGRLFEGVKSLLVDLKSLLVIVESLLVEAKSLLVRIKRVSFMHKVGTCVL